ncbi:hypothetical protein CRENBAI_011237 [Crenichthys baileyi]|uniref:Uncharacterized protein n=1 Tax=Crenichthys baileyi TaxID=28760 RepID=A0AAV9RYP1_9TELE
MLRELLELLPAHPSVNLSSSSVSSPATQRTPLGNTLSHCSPVCPPSNTVHSAEVLPQDYKAGESVLRTYVPVLLCNSASERELTSSNKPSPTTYSDSCVLGFLPVRYLVSSQLQVFQRTSSDNLQLAAFWLLSGEILQRTLLTSHRAHHPQVPTPVTYSPTSWKSLTSHKWLSALLQPIIRGQYSSLPDTGPF